MEWVKDGVNYWENPECPNEYLEISLIKLVEMVEGVELPADFFKGKSREFLVREVGAYEYFLDK